MAFPPFLYSSGGGNSPLETTGTSTVPSMHCTCGGSTIFCTFEMSALSLHDDRDVIMELNRWHFHHYLHNGWRELGVASQQAHQRSWLPLLTKRFKMVGTCHCITIGTAIFRTTD